MRWTAADIPDQAGRTAVVTGANSGLGLRTALELARHRARVVLACRDQARGAEAVARVTGEVPEAAVELALLDLADLASVRAFAEAFSARHDGLDLLVNNAGVMALPMRHTADGFELQFGTNHLGHFALTGLLLAQLLDRPGARIVTVSSGAHRVGRVDFDNLAGERRYGRWRAYAQSKLANLLFTLELQSRIERTGVELSAVAAHPGYASTNLQAAGARMQGNRAAERVTTLMNRFLGQPDSMGALPILYAATAPNIVGGDYVGPDGPFEQRGYPRLVSMAKQARDRDAAQRLWAVSERLTGVRYEALPGAA